MKEKRVTVKVNEKLHKELRCISAEDDITLQDMFVEAIKSRYSKRISDKVED